MANKEKDTHERYQPEAKSPFECSFYNTAVIYLEAVKMEIHNLKG